MVAADSAGCDVGDCSCRLGDAAGMAGAHLQIAAPCHSIRLSLDNAPTMGSRAFGDLEANEVKHLPVAT